MSFDYYTRLDYVLFIYMTHIVFYID